MSGSPKPAEPLNQLPYAIIELKRVEPLGECVPPLVLKAYKDRASGLEKKSGKA